MLNYLLKDINPELWKRFKASCDLEGVTIREALLHYIQTRVHVSRVFINYRKADRFRQTKIGEKT